MPRDTTTLEYATPARRAAGAHITGGSVARFVAGLTCYGVVAWSISLLDTMAGAELLDRVGLGQVQEPVLWGLGLGFLWFVIHAQRKWRWTGFTLGVVAGIGLTAIGVVIFLLVFAFGMQGF